MKWVFVLTLTVGLVMKPAAGQPLSVYSEFARIDAQGNVMAPETPREILSPAVVRNGFTSFQVVVQVSAGTPYTLRVGQNPDNAAKITFYRRRAEGGRFKDRIAEPSPEPINGDATRIFWMDVWIDKDAPVRRIKVEPQLFVNGDWVIYPMEMRVRENIVPEIAPSGGRATAASSPFEMLRTYLCTAATQQRTARESSEAEQPGPASSNTVAAANATGDAVSLDALHLRNARQDVALTSLLPALDRDELRRRMGGCNARAPENPELYLGLRDYFFTPLSMQGQRGN